MNGISSRPICWLYLIVSVLLSGCWSSVELHDRAFVNILIFDKTESGYKMTLGFPLPNRLIPGETGGAGTGGKKPYSYVTKSGKSISEAYQNIQVDMSRTIFFGQTRVVVVTEKLAKDSIAPVLEFLLREPSLHINASLFMLQKSELLLEQSPMVFERFVNDVLESFTKRHSTIDTTIKDVLSADYNGGDELVPLLDFSKQPVDKTEQKRWLGTDGAAIIREGKLMKPKLTPEETRATLWISSKVNNLVVSVDSPLDKKDISIMIPSAKTSITPRYDQGKMIITVLSKAKGYVLASDSKLHVVNPDILEKIELQVEEKVRKEIVKAIEKPRSVQSDAFNFGSYIDWKYPVVWETIKAHWREYYANELQVRVKVDIQLEWTGSSQKSVTDQFHLQMGN